MYLESGRSHCHQQLNTGQKPYDLSQTKNITCMACPRPKHHDLSNHWTSQQKRFVWNGDLSSKFHNFIQDACTAFDLSLFLDVNIQRYPIRVARRLLQFTILGLEYRTVPISSTCLIKVAPLYLLVKYFKSSMFIWLLSSKILFYFDLFKPLICIHKKTGHNCS